MCPLGRRTPIISTRESSTRTGVNMLVLLSGEPHTFLVGKKKANISLFTFQVCSDRQLGAEVVLEPPQVFECSTREKVEAHGGIIF